MRETQKYIRQQLSGLYPPEEIENMATLILEYVCRMPHYRIIMENLSLSGEQKAKIHAIVERLQKEEPLQYILGETDFYNLSFCVDRHTLIPRPETEELVDRIIRDSAIQNELSILDVGTGSGCIAIALAKHLPQATVTGIDISAEALKTARKNAEHNGCENICFKQVDILDNVQASALLPGEFDIIVSNPPYIMEKEKSNMETNVLAYEPASALFVSDDDPLIFYRSIAIFGKGRLRKGGALYFEINALLGKEMTTLLWEQGYTDIELIRDLSGKDRIIKAKTKEI